MKIYDINGNSLKLTQWDTNRTVLFDKPSETDLVVHIFNNHNKAAKVVPTTVSQDKISCAVPNELLQEAKPIYFMLYAKDGGEGKVLDSNVVEVEKKAKPEDYTFVENIEYTDWVQLTADAKALMDNLNATAGAIQEENITIQAETNRLNAETAELNEQSRIVLNQSIEKTLTNYFNMRRTGKIFSTKFYKFATSQSSAGEKLNDNAGMICEASTDTVRGRDDYQLAGLFQHFTCNWSVDPEGFIHIDALEGDKNFKKEGEVMVGEVTCSGWIGIEDFSDSYIISYSDKKSDKTPYPMKEAVNPDGTVNPFMVHAKYLGVNIGGKLWTSAGKVPANWNPTERTDTCYSTQITLNHKHGNQYSGICTCDLFYRQLMLMIKYGTLNMQSIMYGNHAYSNQVKVSLAETDAARVILKTSDANYFVVGSTIMIGDNGTAEHPGRHEAAAGNIAYDAVILKIEPIDEVNSAMYIDKTVTTTATTTVSTWHWKTGSTDCVLGSDGSPGSNSDGKHPCKIQGIEFAMGGAEILGNAIMDIVEGPDGLPVRDIYVCYNSPDLSSSISVIKQKYKKTKGSIPTSNAGAGGWGYVSCVSIEPELGIMVQTELNAGGSSVGFADGVYTNDQSVTSGQREFYCVGHCGYGSNAGLWYLYSNGSLGDTYWDCLAGVSPNGCRGEYLA